jgi:hypothetical protein
VKTVRPVTGRPKRVQNLRQPDHGADEGAGEADRHEGYRGQPALTLAGCDHDPALLVDEPAGLFAPAVDAGQFSIEIQLRIRRGYEQPL